MRNGYLRSILQSEKPKTILRYERTLNGKLLNDLRMPSVRLQ